MTEESPKTGRAPVEKLPVQATDSPPATTDRSFRARRLAEPSAQPQALPPRRSISERWSARGSITLGMIGFLLLFGGFGAWAYFTPIAGAVVAGGQVEVEQRRQVVQHPDGGVVSEILVHEGETVQSGQTLLVLDGSMLKTELAIVEGQYFEMLARHGRLEAERADNPTITFPAELIEAAETHPTLAALMAGQQSLFAARRDTLDQTLAQLNKQAEQVSSQIEGIDAQSAALKTQRELIEEELTSQRALLEKGLAQAARVLSLEREAARLDGQMGSLTSSRAEAVARLTEIDLSKLGRNAEHREAAETDLRDLGYRELEMAERRRGLREQISRLEIRAPVSGVVQELQVTTPRSVVRPAEPLLYIIPQDRPLVISARIATINVDEVHVGQEVVLRFSAFSSRTTPEIDGVLSKISPDALVDQATNIPYYRGEVSIPADQIAKLGDQNLVPGMPVEVYIQTGNRSALTYLIKPLSDYFVRAFREG